MHDVLAGDLSRSMQKDATDYDAFSSALAESPFYKEELSRRGLTPETYRTSIEQAVKQTSGVGLPKEQAQYEAAMRFAKEVLFEDPAAIARMKQTDPELFSKVKAWTERVHARLSGSSQENAANALWSMYDKADGGNGGTGGTGSGRPDGPELPPTGALESGEVQAIELEGRDGENAPFANEETVAHENQEGYNGEGKEDLKSESSDFYVSPKGKVLPAQYKEWLGENQREGLMNAVQNVSLKKIVGEIYRKDSIIGDGGTADIIRFERATGILLSKTGHMQKANDMIRYLEKLLNNGSFTTNDKQIIKRILEDLQSAIGGN